MVFDVPLRERHGFQKFGMRLLYGMLYPFFSCKSNIPQELMNHQEPVVFVCNHYELFGPLAIMTSLKTKFRVWSNEQLLNANDQVEQLVDGAVVMAPVFSQKAMKWILGKISPLIEWVFHQLGAIPVSRENAVKLIRTLRQSASVMEAGDNLVIFPEIGEPHYELGDVSPFYSGFAMVGEFASRKRNNPICFCPVYVDKAKRKLTFGQLVQYHPGNPQLETQRISDCLYWQMKGMAMEAGYHTENDE